MGSYGFGMNGVLDGIRMAEADGRAIEQQGWQRDEQEHQSAMRPLQLESARLGNEAQGMQVSAMGREFEDDVDYRNGLALNNTTPGQLKAKQTINQADVAQISADNAKFAGLAHQTARGLQTASSDEDRGALINGLMTHAPHFPMSNEENDHPTFKVHVNSDPSKGKRGVWFEDDKGQSGGFEVPQGEDFNAATYRFIEELVNPERFAERWYATKEKEKEYTRTRKDKAEDRNADLAGDLTKIRYQAELANSKKETKPSVFVPGAGNLTRDQAMQEFTQLGNMLQDRTKSDSFGAMMAASQIQDPAERKSAMDKLFSGEQGKSIMSEARGLAQRGDPYAQQFLVYANTLYRPISAMGLGGNTTPAPAPKPAPKATPSWGDYIPNR